jgi:predicted regulator of Ras-like GTPase activity (Roadblock/LC7/MglB family)
MRPSTDDAAALQALSSVPGVAGGLLFGAAGELLAARLPPTVASAGLERLGQRLAGDAYLREWLSGDAASLELRYGNGIAVLRPAGDAWLLVLCTPQVNSQLLSMSLNQVVHRRQAAPPPAEPAPAPRAPPSVAERLRAVVEAELGAHAPQAVEILGAAGEDRKALRRAADDVERLTKLFISTRKAAEIAGKMQLILEG